MKTIGTATRELTNIPFYWEILTLFNSFCEASKALIPKQNGVKKKGKKIIDLFHTETHKT